MDGVYIDDHETSLQIDYVLSPAPQFDNHTGSQRTTIRTACNNGFSFESAVLIPDELRIQDPDSWIWGKGLISPFCLPKRKKPTLVEIITGRGYVFPIQSLNELPKRRFRLMCIKQEITPVPGMLKLIRRCNRFTKRSCSVSWIQYPSTKGLKCGNTWSNVSQSCCHNREGDFKGL